MYVYILNKTQTEKKNKNKKDPYKFEHFLSIKSEKKENHIKRRKTEKKTNQKLIEFCYFGNWFNHH